MIDLLVNFTDLHRLDLIHFLFQCLIAGILLNLIHHLPNSKIYFPKDAFDQCCRNGDEDEMH
jgi:hypothetical protein